MFTHLKHLRLSLSLILVGASFLLLFGCSNPTANEDTHSANRQTSDTDYYSDYPANSNNQPNLITQYGDSNINQIK